MGGYVTNSRQAVKPFSLRYSKDKKYIYSINDVAKSPPQVTTSYRTRSKYVSSDDVLFKVGTGSRTFRALKAAQPDGPSSSYDQGHTFDTVTYEVDGISIPFIHLTGSGRLDWFEGPLIPNPQDHNISGATYPQGNNAPFKEYYSTRAIRNTIPTRSPASLAEALIELKREGIPRLTGKAFYRDRDLPSLGGEYLNHEFGWKPIVRDIEDTARAILRSEEIIEQYKRDSGRIVRRSWTFPEVITSTTYAPKVGRVQLPNDGDISKLFYDYARGTLRETLKTVHKYWFKGAYSYYLPANISGEGFKSTVNKANYLLGLELTPEVLWEVVPWSWLSDWMLNVGDVISNASALGSDGLVLRYGYLMCQSTYERSVFLDGIRYNTGALVGPVTATYRTIRKERIRATPYGFGTNPGSFTTRQWAILAALGLTKSDKKLRYND